MGCGKGRGVESTRRFLQRAVMRLVLSVWRFGLLTSRIEPNQVVLRANDLTKVGFVRHDVRSARTAGTAYRCVCERMAEPVNDHDVPGLKSIGPKYSGSVVE